MAEQRVNLKECLDNVRLYKQILENNGIQPVDLTGVSPTSLPHVLWMCHTLLNWWNITTQLVQEDSDRLERWSLYVGDILRKNRLV